jgi:hypothetical protein
LNENVGKNLSKADSMSDFVRKGEGVTEGEELGRE